eukprot:351806-Chlamydomonas_euryale.AAC.3
MACPAKTQLKFQYWPRAESAGVHVRNMGCVRIDADNDEREPIDALEIFEHVRDITDPEHPYTLEQLNVVAEDLIEVDDAKGRVMSPHLRGDEHCVHVRYNLLGHTLATGKGRRPYGTLHPTAQMCAAAGMPQLMHILNAPPLTCPGHVARMPDESVVMQLCLLKGWWDWVAWSADPAPCGGTGLQRLCALYSRRGWRGGVGMGWLRTVRKGMPFVIAPSPLLHSLCLAALNTGIPFVSPLPVTPGSHSAEAAVNKQLADKERVAAALENPNLLDMVERCLSSSPI